jgi:hypothetical protein
MLSVIGLRNQCRNIKNYGLYFKMSRNFKFNYEIEDTGLYIAYISESPSKLLIFSGR